MKLNVEMKVNVSLFLDELDLLSTVLCGLTSYSREELKRILNVKEFNRFKLDLIAAQFGSLYEKCDNARKCYEG